MRTSKVFQLTNNALMSGKVGLSLRGLRILSERADHFDQFCSHDTYMRRLRAGNRKTFGKQLQLALDSANMTAELNLAVRGLQLEQDGLNEALEAYELEAAQDNAAFILEHFTFARVG